MPLILNDKAEALDFSLAFSVRLHDRYTLGCQKFLLYNII